MALRCRYGFLLIFKQVLVLFDATFAVRQHVHGWLPDVCARAANTVICDVFMHFCQDNLCSCVFWRLAFAKTHLPNFRTFTVFVGRVLGMVATGWTLVTDFLVPHPCAVCCTKRRKRCKYQCFGYACNMNDVLNPPTPPTPAPPPAPKPQP